MLAFEAAPSQIKPSQSNNYDFFGLGENGSSINTPQFTSSITTTKSELFSFGQPNSFMNSKVSYNNNPTVTKP